MVEALLINSNFDDENKFLLMRESLNPLPAERRRRVPR